MFQSQLCWLTRIVLAASGTVAHAQVFYFSLDPGSPEVPVPFSAADMALMGPGIPGVAPIVAFPAASLGLPVGANVDAYSDGFDPLSPIGTPYPFAWVMLAYSVGPGTVGVPGTLIFMNAAPGGNGATSDVYIIPPCCRPPYLRSDRAS